MPRVDELSRVGKRFDEGRSSCIKREQRKRSARKILHRCDYRVECIAELHCHKAAKVDWIANETRKICVCGGYSTHCGDVV